MSLEERIVTQQNPTARRSARVLARRRRAFTGAVALALSCTAGSALAVENLWTGAVSTDWNDPANWSLGRVPIAPNGQPEPDNFDDAVINVITPNIATISADIPTPRDIVVGFGPGTNGQVNHNAGSAATGSGGNWMFVGRNGGTGTYNLTGSGSLNVAGRLYIAGHNGAAATGTLNIDTTGTLAMGGDLNLGAAGGTGTVNLDAGTVAVGSWLSVGRDENGLGGTGNFNQSGGSIAVAGHSVLGLPGTTGNLNMTGGTHTTTGEFWVGNGVGESVPGTGVAVVNGGTITANNWIAVGRDGGLGTLSIGGTGTVAHQSNGHITIGTGAGGNGTVNVSGGGTLSTTGNLIVAENNATAVAVVNQTGGTVRVGGNLEVQRTGTGTYNLSGGTLSVAGTIDGLDGTFAFTGGTITRPDAGVITYDGNLTTGGTAATLGLGNDKTFDVNGVLNIVAGNTFDLTGLAIPTTGGAGAFELGNVDSIVGTFVPGLHEVVGLDAGGATFLSEAQGEGGLFDPSTQNVFWVQESGGVVSLQYSVVPEPGALVGIGMSALMFLTRRRKM